MSGYMIFWSKERIKELKKGGDKGPICVVYGGRHKQEPALGKIKVGDVIFPVSLEAGKLYVMARLSVEKLEDAFEYQLRETGMPRAAIVPEGTLTLSDGHLSEERGKFASFRGGCGYLDEITLPEGLTRTIDLDKLTEKPCKAHQIPITCCSEIAAVGTGSRIEAKQIPDEMIVKFRFGATKSSEKGLRLNKEGKLTSISMAGFVRKMSKETFEFFERMFE